MPSVRSGRSISCESGSSDSSPTKNNAPRTSRPNSGDDEIVNAAPLPPIADSRVMRTNREAGSRRSERLSRRHTIAAGRGGDGVAGVARTRTGPAGPVVEAVVEAVVAVGGEAPVE